MHYIEKAKPQSVRETQLTQTLALVWYTQPVHKDRPWCLSPHNEGRGGPQSFFFSYFPVHENSCTEYIILKILWEGKKASNFGVVR